MTAEPSRTIYRKAALDRLSSPEQLDQLMVVARPADWLGVTALAAIALTALVWGLFGTVATRVTGSGILVGQGGHIFTPVANGEGTVIAVTVAPGQLVRAGEVVAQIAQPELAEDLATARATVADDGAQLAAVERQVATYAAARASNNSAQRRLLLQEQAEAILKADTAQRQLAAAETVGAQGGDPHAGLDDRRQQLAAARQAVAEAGSRLIGLNAAEVSARNDQSRDLLSFQGRLAEARRRVRDLEAELDQKQWVRSPVAGRVIEIKAPVGSRAEPGMPVAAIENGETRLQLVLYVPPRDGKLVKPGMLVHVAPSVARREQVGTMVGRVVEVSDFPATQQAMLATLQNQKLVDDFASGGAPITARVALLPDPRTPTGYRWAGGRGPGVPLTSGTLAEAEVTVDRSRPISFAIPLIRGAVGL